MLLTVQGYFEAGMFVAEEPVKIPGHKKAILTILEEESPTHEPQLDNGSLAYLFRDYHDDNIREPLIYFGEAVGNEKW
ncbi:hypothetical protein FACS1894142_2920 [Spirochaetia bacterium]|nr:hypothetical protein FACS1894142_2920 [Spirochaetia bacterium]